jgi:A/G-specific adenine glycosylase
MDATGRTYIQQRITKDIWKGLYQFPLLEVGEKGQLSDEVLDDFLKSELQLSPTVKPMVTTARQLLTHQTIFVYFYFFELDRTLDLTVSNYDLVNQQNVSNFAYPKVISTYLANNRLSLF